MKILLSQIYQWTNVFTWFLGVSNHLANLILATGLFVLAIVLLVLAFS